MADNLVVGLSSWIIQDGNYGDFSRGDHAAFAIEFYASTELTAVNPRRRPTRSLIHVGDAQYRTVGQVVHVAEDWWVIDAGTQLYREDKPPHAVQVGHWLEGEICIGIDPFSYFERLTLQPNAPPLIYDWTIEKIEMQTAPFIEIHPRVMGRDPERLGWKEIASTDAWKDDEGRAEYLIHCKRADGPARRTLSRTSQG